MNKLYFIIPLVVILLIGISFFVNHQLSKPISPKKQVVQQTPSGCTIGNRQFAVGDNPENECQTCDPSKNPNQWSNKDNGVSCRNNVGICKDGLCIPKNAPPADGSGGGSGG